MDENEMIEQQTSEEAVNNEPMTLDEALAAARAEVEARENAPEEAPVEEAVPETEAVAEEQSAVEEANAPTEAPVAETVPPQNDAIYQQLQMQNQQLMQQLQMMQQQMQQMAQQAQEVNRSTAEEVVSAVMTPPTFDISSIMYASEDEQRAAAQKFVDDTMQYTRGKIMEELAPMVNDFRAREADVQRRNVKDAYRGNNQYAGFQDREPWMEQIIEKNPELKQLPLNKQYEIAYLITQGVDAVKARDNPPPAPAPKSMDEQLSEIENNPELMRALEARRVKGIAQNKQDNPPPYVAGGGSNRVGLNIPEEPTDFDMARSGALNYLLGRK
jgi:hypothetical protein